jgi:hypothetical protein
MPYGVSFIEKEDANETGIVSESLKKRLEMFVRDVAVYGRLLAVQRQLDLAGSDPGFLARHRNKRP